MTTEFGQMIKILRIKKDNISQDELASKLDYSQGYLSNIVTGKIDPDIEFLLKCQKYFDLDKDETIALFKAAFSSCKTFTLPSKYLPKDRREWLTKVIVTLLLMPELPFYDSNNAKFEEAISRIDKQLTEYKELRTFND
jgi:transcriptional regulator with XRE-family HTH domain